MAFLKKPLKWTALGQEPSELKKSEGFKMDESPAPGHFDFMFRSTYEAIEELQQKAGEVKTVNNVQPDSNGNVLITLPDTSKLYQKPTSGIPKTDLDATVQASLKKADDAAPLTELAKTNQTVAAHQAEDATNAKKGHVQLVDDVNGNSTSLVPTQNAVRKKVEQTGYKMIKSGKDSNGVFTTVQFYRKSDNTLAEKSVLSGGTSPKYTTRTVTNYGIDGTTVETTETYTLSYDTDGQCSSEV